jgi:uncharacterized protein
MFETLAFALSVLLILLGLAGSVLPILPGPPLSFAGLLILALIHDFSAPLTSTRMIIMALAMLVAAGADYLLPLMGAKRYGASKWGVWGSALGMIIGLFFPPLGMLIGAFAGAVIVELVFQKQKGQAFRAGWGVFMGTMLALVLRLGVSGLMTYYFVLGLLRK